MSNSSGIKLLLFVLLIICQIQGAVAVNPTDGFVWNYSADNIVSSVSISDNGFYLAAGGYDGNVYLFTNDGKKLWNYNTDDYINSVSISADGSCIAAGGASGVYFFNCEGEKVWSYKTGDDISVNEVSISADGSYVAVGCKDYNVYFFNRGGEKLWSYKTGDDIHKVSISADGSYVAAGGVDYNVYLFSHDGEKLWSYNTGGYVNSLAISADGSYVAVEGSYFLGVGKGYDTTFYFFNRDGKKLWSYKLDVKGISISADGSYVAVGDWNGKVYLFNRDGEELWNYYTYENIRKVSLSADGSYVAAGGNRIYLFNHDGEKLWSYYIGDVIRSVSISADGTYVAVGAQDNKVHLFNSDYAPIIQTAKAVETTTSSVNTANTNGAGWSRMLFLILGIGLILLVVKTSSGRSRSSISASKPDNNTKRSQDDTGSNLGSSMEFAKLPMELAKLKDEILLKDAKSFIQDAEVNLRDALNKGVHIPQGVQQLLQDAQKELDAGHVVTAKGHAHDCIEKVSAAVKDFTLQKAEQARKQRELEQMRKSASEKIKSAGFTLQQAERLGVKTQRAKELNAKAQSAFDTSDYSKAMSYAQQGIDVTDRLIGESKPSISIELPPKMKYNYWRHQDITIANNGTAHAKNITISFSKALETREMKNISQLNIGEKQTIQINVKPTEAGEVPVDYSIKFHDHLDRMYETQNTTIIQISAGTEAIWDGGMGTVESKEKNIKIKSAFGYKGATIQYKIKIENPTPEPIGDINVYLYVPDVFLVSESTKTVVMLKPNEGKTVTFEIRPTGECGDCEVSGKVIYYDYSTKKTNEIDIPIKNLSIVCPMLKVKEIGESEWHNIVGSLVETEENTREIDMPAETLFAISSRIVKDMHMYSLNPEISGNQRLFSGVARFYGEGVKELKYAAQIEVVGGAKKSKLILKAWAEREDALTGFYHGILDELEKRVQVKGYINDSIVQNFYHYGDNIGTQVKDSFVYKSNVGSGETETCPQCGKGRVEGEKFCSGCGMKF